MSEIRFWLDELVRQSKLWQIPDDPFDPSPWVRRWCPRWHEIPASESQCPVCRTAEDSAAAWSAEPGRFWPTPRPRHGGHKARTC